jgi:hypothetical protein
MNILEAMADLALFVTLALGPFLGRPTSPGLGRQGRANAPEHRPHPLPALPSIPPYPFCRGNCLSSSTAQPMSPDEQRTKLERDDPEIIRATGTNQLRRNRWAKVAGWAGIAAVIVGIVSLAVVIWPRVVAIWSILVTVWFPR